jgi:single-stranded-DNA-specific exonuclease
MRWVLRNADPQLVQRLALETNLPPWLARLLAVRGIQSGELAHKFLNPSLQDLHSP